MADEQAVAACHAAIASSVRFDRSGLMAALAEIHGDAAVAGAEAGLRYLGRPEPLSEREHRAAATRWHEWEPSDKNVPFGRDAAPGIAGNVDLTATEVIGSAIDRMAHALADGLANGDSDDTIKRAMSDAICDTARAEVIARTETARAQGGATLNVFRRHGLSQWNWHAEKNPCVECNGNEESSPHPLAGDLTLPAHPNCRCNPLPHWE